MIRRIHGLVSIAAVSCTVSLSICAQSQFGPLHEVAEAMQKETDAEMRNTYKRLIEQQQQELERMKKNKKAG